VTIKKTSSKVKPAIEKVKANPNKLDMYCYLASISSLQSHFQIYQLN